MSGTDVVVKELNHLSIIDNAVQSGADIETLERLMQLQERHEDRQARKAFIEAMSLFREKCPPIVKDSFVSYVKKDNSQTEYKHSSLGKAIETIKPILKECGINHVWKTEDVEGGRVRVTCEMSHVGGHMESTSLSAAHDTSGGKNSIQALGSTVTYLERYTLFSILGLASTADDDGEGADLPEYITDEQVDLLDDMLADRNVDPDLFRKWLVLKRVKDGDIKNTPATMFEQVVARIKKNDNKED